MKKPRANLLVCSRITFDNCLFNIKTLETARGSEKTEPEGAKSTIIKFNLLRLSSYGIKQEPPLVYAEKRGSLNQADCLSHTSQLTV